ncbi:hypothetical protein E4U41_007218 [Claviceps citrina]|nr:hypothetical protein E4U41_007218 [Claviceps citrina]
MSDSRREIEVLWNRLSILSKLHFIQARFSSTNQLFKMRAKWRKKRVRRLKRKRRKMRARSNGSWCSRLQLIFGIMPMACQSTNLSYNVYFTGVMGDG